MHAPKVTADVCIGTVLCPVDTSVFSVLMNRLSISNNYFSIAHLPVMIDH